MWASLVRSEELWEALCVASWPLVHRLPRSAYSSWRLCHRSRCSGTPPGTWQKLLPLYDESAVLAIERPGGWIGRLGATLLRIRSVRKLHGLHNWPRVGARGSRAGVSQACNEEEGLSWLHSVHDALSSPQAAHELLAFAGGVAGGVAGGEPPQLPSERVETAEEHVMRRGGICSWLDAWYDNNNNNEPALLLRFLAARSALHAIRHMQQVARRRFGQASCPFEDTEALEAALSRADASVRSLHEEGCDLSVTAVQLRTHGPGVPPSHWWWQLEAPAYVSGGNPLIAPLPEGALHVLGL